MCFASKGGNFTVGTSAFQGSHTGSTHGNHAPATSTSVFHCLGHIGIHFNNLTMHMVIFYTIHLYWLKSTGTHMQGNSNSAYTLVTNSRQHRLVKMQTRRRCSNGTMALTKHRLVTLAVGCFIGAVNIRRQGHMTNTLQYVQHGLFAFQVQLKQSALTCHHGGPNFAFQQQTRTRLRRATRAYMGKQTTLI